MAARPGMRTSKTLAGLGLKPGDELPKQEMPSRRRRVMLESPYQGETERNEEYARRALRDSLDRNEAPIAGHLLYTQVLEDKRRQERYKGMSAAFSWLHHAELVVVYTDYGITDGMREGIKRAEELHIPVELRSIGRNP